MRGIDIFCVSQAATAIRLTMDDDASSSSSSSAVHLGGSRFIDRHNPIISDPKRSSIPKSPPPHSPRTKSTPSNPKNDKNKKETVTKEQKKVKKKKSGTSDFVRKSSGTISCAKGGGFISPAGSSRYLLGESTGLLGQRTGLLGESDSVSGKRTGFLGERTGLLEGFPDLGPVPALVPDDKSTRLNTEVSGESIKYEKTEIVKKVEDPGLNSNGASSSRSSNQQVVVLRVSLHCRGCAGKVRKHISRMQGVTSFSIDFAAKKVTVVGDVTPLGVLASISKVKTAQLWTPPNPNPKPSSLPVPTSTHSEIRKNKGIVV